MASQTYINLFNLPYLFLIERTSTDMTGPLNLISVLVDNLLQFKRNINSIQLDISWNRRFSGAQVVPGAFQD